MRRSPLGALVALGLTAGLLVPTSALAAFLRIGTARQELRRTMLTYPTIRGATAYACRRVSRETVRCRVRAHGRSLRGTYVCNGVGQADLHAGTLSGHAWDLYCHRPRRRR